MFVKMCGMMTSEHMQFCWELGIQAAGIVVEYPRPVPWNLSRDDGRRLVRVAPPELQMVMVCSGTPDTIEELAAHVRPHIAQVHGDETLAQVAEIVERLRPMGIGVFRALRIAPETKEAAGELSDPVEAAQAMEKTGVKAIVVDSKVPDRPGGTGVAVDMQTLRRVVEAVSVPVIAAGGLAAANVATVVEYVKPWGVDVLSGIEAEPGVKDRPQMAQFVQAVRNVGVTGEYHATRGTR